MSNRNKSNSRKGFTLAELLIVVAIIGILVAIAIPVFITELEKTREATDAANIRAAYAEVMTDAIADGLDHQSKVVILQQKIDGWQNVQIGDSLNSLSSSISASPTSGGTVWVEYFSGNMEITYHYENSSDPLG